MIEEGLKEIGPVQEVLDAHDGVVTVIDTADGNVTAKDVDCYCSADTTARGAVTAGTELAFEARNINLMGQKVWEDAGDSSAPGGYYLLGFESEAAGDTAGDISWIVTYVVD